MDEQDWIRDVLPHRPRLILYATKQIGGRWYLDPEEAVDHALQRFWNVRDQFEKDTHVSKSWVPLLQQFVRYSVMSLHGFATEMKRDARVTQPFDLNEHDYFAISEDVLWDDELKFEDSRLNRWDDLSEMQKRLAWLKYVDGLSAEEITGYDEFADKTPVQIRTMLESVRVKLRRNPKPIKAPRPVKPKPNPGPVMEWDKYCGQCRVVKPKEAFSKHSGAVDGLQHECKDCASERYFKRKKPKREKPVPHVVPRVFVGPLLPDGHKSCFTCREIKPLDAFTARKSAKDGLNGSCRRCESVARRAREIKNETEEQRQENYKTSLWYRRYGIPKQ